MEVLADYNLVGSAAAPSAAVVVLRGMAIAATYRRTGAVPIGASAAAR
jgi:hypothetical protein